MDKKHLVNRLRILFENKNVYLFLYVCVYVRQCTLKIYRTIHEEMHRKITVSYIHVHKTMYVNYDLI